MRCRSDMCPLLPGLPTVPTNCVSCVQDSTISVGKSGFWRGQNGNFVPTGRNAVQNEANCFCCDCLHERWEFLGIMKTYVQDGKDGVREPGCWDCWD